MRLNFLAWPSHQILGHGAAVSVGKDAAAMKLRQALRARYVLAGYVAAESTSFASHQYRMHRMENAPRCAPVQVPEPSMVN